MKVHISPPKNRDLFYHEAQTARKARYIIGGLQLLSGTTALIGLRLYFSEWLDDLHPVLTYGILALIAFMLIAPGEIGIRETWGYIFRAVLNRYNKGLNLFSLVLMGLVAVFLTSYSFYLSQYATRSSMKRAAPKVELQDTRHISEDYETEMKRIAGDYETKRNDVNSRYKELIKAEESYYSNLIAAKEAEIEQLKKKEWLTGQRYTTKINNLSKQSLSLETKRAESVKELRTQQNGELAALESWRSTAETEAKEEKKDNKSAIVDRNQALEQENQEFAQLFSSLVARFAAWSVILVILFTGYLEIFYYKTGIKRVIKFNTTDFQSPVFVELLTFPYVYLSRHMTNFVRQRYHKLPEVMPAPGTENLFEDEKREMYKWAEQEVEWKKEEEAFVRQQKEQWKQHKEATTSDAKTAAEDKKAPEKEPPVKETTTASANKAAQDDEAFRAQFSFWQAAASPETKAGTGNVHQTNARQEKKEPKVEQSFSNTPEPEPSVKASTQAPPIKKKQKPKINYQRTDLSGIFQNTTTVNEDAPAQTDDEPEAEPAYNASGVYGSGSAQSSGPRRNGAANAENRTELNDLTFNQEPDFRATIKHVNRRTGEVNYYDQDDLDAMLEDYGSKIEEASEMYHETGDPMYLAAIEDAKSAITYWQSRKLELVQRTHHSADF